MMNREQICLASVVVGLLSLFPLAFVRWPPLIDYLPHLTRVFIEHSLLIDNRFSDRFMWNLQVVPNLGFDAVVLPLTLLGISIAWAGKIFVMLVILLNGFAVITLHHTLFGRLSPVPLIAFAFTYTELLIFGFLTSELSVALALIAFATYLRGSRAVSTTRLLAFVTVSVVVLFFTHLLGALVFLGLIAADAISSRWIAPALARIASFFQPPLGRLTPLAPTTIAIAVGTLTFFALLALAPVSASNNGENATNPADFLQPKLWRWSQIINPLLGYDLKVDFSVLGVIGGVLFLFFFFGRLQIASTTLLGMAGLAVAYIFVPSGWGSTYYIAERFPFVLMLLSIASVDLKFTTPAACRAATLFIVLLVLVRSLSAAANWNASAEARNAMFDALANTRPNDKVCQARNASGNIHSDLTFPFVNLTSYATIASGAFAYVFALPDQNLIVPRPEWAPILKRIEINNRVDHNPIRPLPNQDLANPLVLETCNFILITRPNLYQLPLPDILQPLAKAPGAIFYHVEQRSLSRPAAPSK